MSSPRHAGAAGDARNREAEHSANEVFAPAHGGSNAASESAADNAWLELSREWQALAARWSSWWSHAIERAEASTGQASPPAPASPALGYAAIGFDVHKATMLAHDYRRDMEILWRSALEQPAAPDDVVRERDSRFRSTEWNLPYFALLKRAYLRHTAYVRELAELAEIDAAAKQRLRFMVQQYVDALSPANYLATNPEALKRALDSNGSSVMQGLHNLAADVRRGQISTNDATAFAVGRNLAVTPGSVVFRNELFELIQYRASTDDVFSRPLLIVPPCINKYYVLDLQPDNSFVRYAVSQRHTVFMMSWRNIPAELGSLDWDAYLEQGVLKAIDVASAIAGADDVNALGFCVGGTLLASALAVLAARQSSPVSSATFLTTLLDFENPGDIAVYVSDDAIAHREPALLRGERMRGRELSTAFASLRANDLVWNYVVNNYLKGRQPPAFDLLFWNGDSANLPGPMVAYYLRRMYLENRLRDRGALVMCGVEVDLSRVKLPAYVLATREDHIVPWQSAFKSRALLGGSPTFVLGASGHIAGVINPAAANRRNYWIGGDPAAETPEEWLAGAESHAGSWWPHWAAWLASSGGALRAAPPREGNSLNPVLAPAPGQYVVEKVL